MKLSPIKSHQKSPKFQVLDIETMNWTKFIVLGYYDGRTYLEFQKIKDFVEFVKTLTEPLNCFSHFGGKFDMLFLIEELLKHDDIKITTIVPRGSSLLYFTIRTIHCDHTFRDSSALLPFSLKSITENFGVETKKGDWDHTKTKGYSKGLAEYLKSDCLGLYQSLETFYSWPLISKAGPATTMASQAIRVFRTYLDEDLFKLGKQQTDFCRQAYLGGRTEIFKPYCEKGPLYEYDVNSLYPFVMRDNYFPSSRSFFSFDFDDKRLGIYECKVKAPKSIYIPVLGVIRDGKYIFPTGKFKGHWTSAEIKYAISLGYKIEILGGYVFEEKKKLFKKFINDLYSIRRSAPKNSVSEIMAKLLMNSSYGRFGMDLSKENISFDMKEGSSEFRKLKIGKKNIQLYKEPIELNSFTHTGIAAFVTSYARIHMHKIMSSLGESLYYTDTDSLFTTSRLDSGTALGELKLEHTYDSAIFLLPKTYMATSIDKNKIGMKGFDKRKIKDFTMDDFKNALEGDLRRFKVISEPKFATFKSSLAKGEIVSMTKATTKQLRAKYDKRIIIKKGNEFTSIPLVINK